MIGFKVKNHEVFERDGYNVFSNVSISFVEALLGCTITIDTLKGPKNIKIKSGI